MGRGSSASARFRLLQANSVLVFDLELLGIKDPAKAEQDAAQ